MYIIMLDKDKNNLRLKILILSPVQVFIPQAPVEKLMRGYSSTQSR